MPAFEALFAVALTLTKAELDRVAADSGSVDVAAVVDHTLGELGQIIKLDGFRESLRAELIPALEERLRTRPRVAGRFTPGEHDRRGQ